MLWCGVRQMKPRAKSAARAIIYTNKLIHSCQRLQHRIHNQFRCLNDWIPVRLLGVTSCYFAVNDNCIINQFNVSIFSTTFTQSSSIRLSHVCVCVHMYHWINKPLFQLTFAFWATIQKHLLNCIQHSRV